METQGSEFDKANKKMEGAAEHAFSLHTNEKFYPRFERIWPVELMEKVWCSHCSFRSRVRAQTQRFEQIEIDRCTAN
jgi:hypothetical protein